MLQLILLLNYFETPLFAVISGESQFIINNVSA